MNKFRSFLTGLALCIGLSAVFTLAACATPGGSDPNASTPASSHFKADLASGFYAIEAVRATTTSALQAHVITFTQAEAVQNQCRAFTATLKSLQASGHTAGSQDVLTATLEAIKAAKIFVSVSQPGVPKS